MVAYYWPDIYYSIYNIVKLNHVISVQNVENYN